MQYEFQLENNDIIFVPVAQRVIEIEGEVRRPMRYELLDSENLMELIDLAGGLKNSAYTGLIQVSRFEENQEVLIDVPLATLTANGRNFNLQDGDIVTIRPISRPVQRFAEVEGAVDYPGLFDLGDGLRISELLAKAVLQPESKRDLAFLLRTNPDQTIRLIRLNLGRILDGSDPDIFLENKDKLLVYEEARYVDRFELSAVGAVRDTFTQSFDARDTIRLQDLVLLAGGLKTNAARYGFIKRVDPQNAKSVSYLRVDLEQALLDPGSEANIILRPQDQLIAFTEERFDDQFEVSISGAVREPGTFPFEPGLTVTDLLTLAGGFQIGAATNRIDIFRLDITDNQGTRQLATSVELPPDFNLFDDKQDTLRLEPFDVVVVRSAPDFEYQQLVELNGKVEYPGPYGLLSENERISSIIDRAGGLTPEGNASGATLFRTTGEKKGFLIMDLARAAVNMT